MCSIKEQFPEACLEVVNAIGKNTLIPPSSLDTSVHLVPLSVVTMTKKKKMVLFYTKEYLESGFCLKDLLIDEGPVLEPEIKVYKVSSYSQTGSSNCSGSLRVQIMKLMKCIYSASKDDSNITDYGQLLLQEIENKSFLYALKERKLNMEHTYIKQINKETTVLCVVKGVVKSSDEVQTTKKGGIKIQANIGNNYGAQGNMGSNREMEINKETPFAYKVWELEVNVDNGHIMPVLTEDYSGGFIPKKIKKNRSDKPDEGDPPPLNDEIQKNRSDKPNEGDPPPPNDEIKKNRSDKPNEGDPPPLNDEIKKNRSDKPNEGDPPPLNDEIQKNRSDKPNEGDPPPPNDVEDNVAELLQDFKDILQPLHHCAKAEDQRIRYSLFDLMTCSSDILALSKILSKAEDGRLNEDKDTLDKQFINNDRVWSILTDVGVQTVDGRVSYGKKATPILIAVSYVIDAILELDNDHLNIIYQCDEQQLKTLLKIFESAVASSETIPIDVDMSSVLEEYIRSFLTRLNFTLCTGSIQPPKTHTCNVECLFCILYCLS